MEHKKLNVRITFLEEVLGTCSNNPEIHAEYIASKAPKEELVVAEVEAISVAEAIEKGMTVFPRTQDGQPFLYDYQIKGFLKDSVGVLRKVPGTHSATVKAYKKEIDGLIFPTPRQIVFQLPEGGEVGRCQRPLRASTPQGERVALADSETVPAGTVIEFEIVCMTDSMKKLVIECLEYGRFRGIGCWRNSGKGIFQYEILEN